MSWVDCAILRIGVCVLPLLVSLRFGVAAADDFYKGKVVRIIAGTAAGSNYDAQGRQVARHLSNQIPGNPKVIVQNMPAAGGLVAINHVFNLAERDGSEIGLFNRATLFAPLLGDPAAKYKVEEFNWLGTPASYSDNAFFFFIRAALPYKSIDDLRRADPPINVGNVSGIVIRAMPESLGVKMKLITGYTGPELNLALQRGELDGLGSSLSGLQNQTPQWLSDGFIRILAQFSRPTRHPDFPDVPLGRELVSNDDDRALMALSEMPLTLGFPFAAPPAVNVDRVALLRMAFERTMNDAAFRGDALKSKLEYSPKTGQQMQSEIQGLSRLPSHVVERFRLLSAQDAGARR